MIMVAMNLIIYMTMVQQVYRRAKLSAQIKDGLINLANINTSQLPHITPPGTFKDDECQPNFHSASSSFARAQLPGNNLGSMAEH